MENGLDALIGYSGFVGSTLLRQAKFDLLYRSSNIHEISGCSLDMVVCAGAPAQKWIANRNPDEDLARLEGLMSRLATIRCRTFVLISTVDVYSNPVGVDESSPVDEAELAPYGLHRHKLERFVENHFDRHLIVRLPGLVGPGLRKNAIFDFLNANNLAAIDSRAVFQFYPMVNLWYDVRTALAADLDLVHFTAEPIGVAEVAEQGFGMEFGAVREGVPPVYDFRTRYAKIFGGHGNYQYQKRESLLAIRAYAQSEVRRMPEGKEGA